MAEETTVTIVHAPACHYCADADELLGELATGYAVRLVRLDIRSPHGQQLAQRHRAAMSPLVLVDGRFFSQGRLPRGKIRALTARLTPLTAVSVGGGR